ncbi:MAG: hypothetical protein KDB66_01675 [Solirubrobacterales bacterium]|nr:hypothetical protein [Solirubrobacterales bacterium]MCB8915162.1 hypothetical protein [Thermoleophilales bacterium]
MLTRGVAVIVLALSVTACVMTGPASPDPIGPTKAVASLHEKCPAVTNASQFTAAARLRSMTVKFNSFGPRNLGSNSHNRAINWLESQARAIGFRISSGRFRPYTWLPTTRFRNRPGLDIGAAGELTVRKATGDAISIPDAGAVHWSRPAAGKGSSGKLVYLPPDEDITAANSAGKVVIRDFQPGSIPFGLIGPILGVWQSADLEGYSDYTRPYLSPNLQVDSLAASKAGAAGVIFAFDLPARQVRGYYDPHTGTIYRQPELFVGRSQGEQLKALAARDASATVRVKARILRKPTRNLIARLPGRSREKMVVVANTDGNSWVQEDGVIGMLAMGKYYASLPLSCRPRTLELVFSTAHDAFRNDGLTMKNYPINKKTTVFGFGLEHLGTREILPKGEGPNRRLVFTGKQDPAIMGAGDSQVLRDVAAEVVQRRKTVRTAVLKGLGVPDPNTAPSICSMGGLGTVFQREVVPTLAIISGPWSLYDPAFGAKAIDFAQMRKQVLAATDAILALDGLPRKEIAGDYPALQAQLDSGEKEPCPPEIFPLHAPGPGS